MSDRPEPSAPQVPWWISAPLALLLSGVFAYAFVSSVRDGDPPWDPPWLATIYRVAYAVLAVLFLGGAAAALRPKRPPQ
jgi:drug/metabolite transporter (DMT)-like permease